MSEDRRARKGLAGFDPRAPRPTPASAPIPEGSPEAGGMLELAGAPREIVLRRREDGVEIYRGISDSLAKLLRAALEAEGRLAGVDLSGCLLHRFVQPAHPRPARAPAAGNLPGLQLRDGRVWACYMRDLGLRGANFRGATLIGVDFNGSDLRGADFRGARFLSALESHDPALRIANSFFGADLLGARFSPEADLSLAGLVGARNLDGAKLVDLDGTRHPRLEIDPRTGLIRPLETP